MRHDARRGITTYYWSGDARWLQYPQDTAGNEDWHLYRQAERSLRWVAVHIVHEVSLHLLDVRCQLA